MLSVIGWWVITCSGISNNVQSIIGMIIFVQPEYVTQKWHSYLMYVGLILITCECPLASSATSPIAHGPALTLWPTVIPIFTIPPRHLGKWTQGCLYLSIAGFIITTVVLCSMTDSFNEASFLVRFDGVSGWPKGAAWVMTIGNAMYAFASTDAVIHVAEEMHNPGKAIPRAM